METLKLYNIAAKNGIAVERFDLPENKSISLKTNSREFIALDNGISSNAEERVCLAHELGHCQTMSFYNIYSPLDVRGKHENRANKWAIQNLIPKSSYLKAIKSGYTDIYSLAEYFDVTEDFMKKVAEFYQPNHY